METKKPMRRDIVYRTLFSDGVLYEYYNIDLYYNWTITLFKLKSIIIGFDIIIGKLIS